MPSGIRFLQDPDDLLFGEPTLFHGLPPLTQEPHNNWVRIRGSPHGFSFPPPPVLSNCGLEELLKRYLDNRL
jgi:hypothetical protein